MHRNSPSRTFPILTGLLTASLFIVSCGKKEEKKNDTETAAKVPTLSFSLAGEDAFPSRDKQVILQRLKSAQEAGKPMIIKVTGAWCPGCAIFDESTKSSERFQKIVRQYEYVTMEEMFFERSTGIDFLPTEIIFYPSTYLFDPKSGIWTVIYPGDAETFAKNLETFKREGGLADSLLQEFRTKAEANENIAKAEYDQGLLTNLVMATAMEKSADEYFAVLGEIAKVRKQSAALFEIKTKDAEGKEVTGYEATLDDFANYGFGILVDTKKLTYPALVERVDAFAEETKSLKSISEQNKDKETAKYHFQTYEFQVPLGHAVRDQGEAAAADLCPTLASKVNDFVQPEPLTLADLPEDASEEERKKQEEQIKAYKKKVTDFEQGKISRDLTCANLAFASGKLSADDLLNKVKDLQENNAIIQDLLGSTSENYSWPGDLALLVASTKLDMPRAIELSNVQRSIYERRSANSKKTYEEKLADPEKKLNELDRESYQRSLAFVPILKDRVLEAIDRRNEAFNAGALHPELFAPRGH